MDRFYQEYFNMFMVLGKCRKKYRQIANTYTYPNREKKSHMAFKWLSECLMVLWRKRKEYEEKQLLMIKTQ